MSDAREVHFPIRPSMSPHNIRRLINFWPPLLFSGIRVKAVAKDWRRVEVELTLRWWNKNAVGSMFGGSLFSMTDPFYPLMLQHNLGRGYKVWVKSADIEFVAPGRDVVIATFELTPERIAEIQRATMGGQKHLSTFSAAIKDAKGKLIASVETVIYVRPGRGDSCQ
jgi:acyl-coenzyme A thioesterase PaaI-like protein